jgi:hypothetical protein
MDFSASLVCDLIIMSKNGEGTNSAKSSIILMSSVAEPVNFVVLPGAAAKISVPAPAEFCSSTASS